VGQRGQVKDIADGYALNFLIPHGLAKQATTEAEDAHKKQQAHDAALNAKKNIELAAQIQKLDGSTAELTVRSNEHGHLFKGVGRSDIAKAIGNGVTSEMIADEKIIKEVGEHKIKIAAAGASATVTLSIVGA